MDRNSGSKRIILSDSEFAKRQAPGRLTRAVASGAVTGDKAYTPIGSGSGAAPAGPAAHEVRREKPELVAKRERAGK
jgi:hypothetical protein